MQHITGSRQQHKFLLSVSITLAKDKLKCTHLADNWDEQFKTGSSGWSCALFQGIFLIRRLILPKITCLPRLKCERWFNTIPACDKHL